VAVTRVPTSTSVLNPAPTLFNRQRILTFEQGTPDTKVAGSLDWERGRFEASARATWYASVTQPGTTASNDLFTGDKTVVDLSGRLQIVDGVALTVGVDNVFDEYPDFTPAALNSNGVLGFPFYSPFGFNGRYVYSRLSLHW
jgi:iron complex outermembrane receptor protein